MNTLVQFPRTRTKQNPSLGNTYPLKGGVLLSTTDVRVIWSKNSFALNDIGVINWFLALDKGLRGNQVYDQAREYGASDQRASALKRLYRARNHPYVLAQIKALRRFLRG